MKPALAPVQKKPVRRRLKGVYFFLRYVIDEFLTDNCSHLAASISYYAFFSLFPLTLAAISILGWLTRDPAIESDVISAVTGALPIESGYIESTIRGVRGAWEATGIVAIIGLLWGGSSVFNATRKALNAAWGVRRPRPFLVERFMELSMMTGLGLLLMVSFGVTLALGIVRQYSIESMEIEFLTDDQFWNMMPILATTFVAFVAFMCLYKFVPHTNVRWRDVWIGALLAAIGFEATKQLFVWYTTSHPEHYNALYGFTGAAIAVMVWIYLSAFIMLFCAKLTAVYARVRAGERLGRPAGVDASTLEYLGPLQAPVENVLLRSRQMIEGSVQSLTPTTWFGIQDTTEKTAENDESDMPLKRPKPTHHRPSRRRRKK